MDIRKQIEESTRLQQAVLADSGLMTQLSKAIDTVVDTYRNGGKVLFCGNGGSAADAQHLAAELSGRFYFDRPALGAEALHVNSSFVTATANDHSFDIVYDRMVQALAKEGDVLFALSTSGRSRNILRALERGRKMKVTTIGLTGNTEANPMAGLCDILMRIPSADTARIQEMHMLFGHILCENVEYILFGSP